jgi:hypothetical protein
MKRCFIIFTLALLAAAGCSQERSRAVTDPAAADQRDYRQMIERSRARQNSQNSLLQMQDALRDFQRDLGRLPTNLVELVIRKFIPAIPSLPAGQTFAYDPSLGLLTVRNVQQPDTLSPKLPPAPELTNRPTLGPRF